MKRKSKKNKQHHIYHNLLESVSNDGVEGLQTLALSTDNVKFKRAVISAIGYAVKNLCSLLDDALKHGERVKGDAIVNGFSVNDLFPKHKINDSASDYIIYEPGAEFDVEFCGPYVYREVSEVDHLKQQLKFTDNPYDYLNLKNQISELSAEIKRIKSLISLIKKDIIKYKEKIIVSPLIQTKQHVFNILNRFYSYCSNDDDSNIKLISVSLSAPQKLIFNIINYHEETRKRILYRDTTSYPVFG
jgi:hypothetical protein